jgi:acyl-CoA reductase-like NAD-dependent aldehyde dehydrogenase
MIPALLAGCSVILKSSPETAIDSLLLGELFIEAGIPDGVVSILPADRDVSEYLISHPGIDKIAFTGSTGAGRTIGATAGRQLKRTTFELGGKSAAIVLDDAHVDAVVAGIKNSSLVNNGEACVAHTRILVHRSIYNTVVEGLADLVRRLNVGNPTDPGTDIGPLVRKSQQDRVLGYIRTGIEEGARLVAGGPDPLEDPSLAAGFYVQPTLFADVRNDMTIAQEEIFGPVLAVIPFDTDTEAVEIANDSEYGLSGGVWSTDPARALRVARQIRTGLIHINGAPRHGDAPFGGFKNSGMGREYGPAGLAAFTETKSIAIGHRH